MPSTLRDIVVNVIVFLTLFAALVIIMTALHGIANGGDQFSDWPRRTFVYDLHPSREPTAEVIGIGQPVVSEIKIHLHCDNEINNGGYRNGKFVYLNQGK